ncbi:MAG: hypothetical protein MEQ07_10120 [Aquimonas sp.]|nr:hypothetical protein [Aquimonas sp.]
MTLRRFALLAVLALACVPAVAAEVQQTFQLRPGWNAIHVELEPSEKDITRVFAGLPVASVWRYIPNDGGARFIRDPSEGLDNLEGWFSWFPEPRPEAFLSNLFSISANTSYLVRLEGTAPRELSVRGRPKLLPTRWQPNSFTLTGLPVSATAAPTFAEYFSVSPAHVGQPIYRLDASGQWQRVTSPATTRVEPGVAYWIHTRGNSRYQGRLGVVLDQSESLEYSAGRDEIRVVLRNLSGLPGSIQVRRIAGDGLPLTYLNEDPETGETGWPDLQQSLVLDVQPGAEAFLTLGLRRSQFTADRMDEVLEISDEHGQRIWLGAGGNTTQPLDLLRQAKGPKAAAVGYAGLWVGEVEVNAVSEAQRAGTDPRPVVRPFEQRVLIHVDSAGQARLLKDVIQMWQDGTARPSSIDPNFNEVDIPGRHVLVTNPALIGLYTGPVNRDGTPVGLRFSTVAYDFAGNEVELDGVFAPGGEVNGTVVVGSNLPTNPFLHRYHPDHDNLDAQFLNPVAEAYQVVRNLRFEFAAEDPLGRNPPGWGDSIVGGTFSESITGLHKNPIFSAGQFRLRRVSAVPVLNQ